MTHRDDVKERLKWLRNKEWYGFEEKMGFYLKKAAPPEIRESFKKWAALQDELGDEGYDYTLEIA